MKTIIAGCRKGMTYQDVVNAFVRFQTEVGKITEVVCGKAAGVDSFGERLAKSRGIPVKEFPADWTRYGNGAGPVRNRSMAQYGEALLAIWDGKTNGTRDMIEQAERRGLKVMVYYPNPKNEPKKPAPKQKQNTLL